MSINKGNVFSSKNLCEYMLSSLPKEASPHLRDPYDAVALLSHACMLTKRPPRSQAIPNHCPRNGTPPPHPTTPSATPTSNPPFTTS
ncbi:MAG: hypothetical protein Q9212_007236 [Teloschistes hypoglaucus]